MVISYKSALTFMCILLLQNALAQSNPHRPKIGVTLSGGGAKGLAHIGILEAIDSAGLKVDYITGTSMGSVVGGMYAVGYSADSIEKIARKLDWGLLLSSAPQIGSISIQEKDEFNKYALEIPFQRGKFVLGKGFIEGQELWLKLAGLFHPAYDVTDFNKLSIPFACVGTDLGTGNAVVMNKGNIITCVRASMAIPAVFTPVQYQNKILVDGGIVDNFPVLEAKKMGADIVIGVNLNNGLEKAEDLTTSLDILMQMAFFKDADGFQRNRDQCNIFILPDLKGNGTGDFDKSDSIIDIGKETGRKYYPIFKRLADSLNALYPHSEPFVKDRLPPPKSMTIGKYSVTGLDKTTEQFFFGLSGLESGKAYSGQEHVEAIRKIYGSRYYKSIKYDFIPIDSGKTEMRFIADENPLTAIKFALNYNDYTKLSLIGNITIRDLLLNGSRATATVSVSENPRLFVEYFKYLGNKRAWGFDFSWYKEIVDFPIYQDFRLFETLRSDYSIFNARIQHNIDRVSYVGINQQYSNSNLKTSESPSAIVDGKNEFWQTYFSYRYDNTDRKYFPTKGWKLRGELGYVYGQNGEIAVTTDSLVQNADSLGVAFSNMLRVNLRSEYYLPLNKKFVLFQQSALAFLSSEDPYIANQFQVGGVADNTLNQVRFAGLEESELKTGSILSGQLGLQWKCTGSIYMTGRVNLAMYNFYKANGLSGKDNFLSGYSLSAGLMTPIGPIELTAMYCDQDRKVRTNLNLGYRF
jgi:NTE family protein